MIKIIQYLVENPDLLFLLQEKKISLLNINPAEQQAIIEAFKCIISPLDLGWR